jgi:hypothetical protein
MASFTEKPMSLRFRLSGLVCIVLLLSLALGSLFAYSNAVRSVRTEMRAALLVGQQTIAIELERLSNSANPGSRHRTGSCQLLVIGPTASPYRMGEPTLSLGAGSGLGPVRNLDAPPTITFTMASRPHSTPSPLCGRPARRTHSRYERGLPTSLGDHAAGRKRRSSRSRLARPYIWRLMVLSRLI